MCEQFVDNLVSTKFKTPGFCVVNELKIIPEDNLYT